MILKFIIIHGILKENINNTAFDYGNLDCYQDIADI